LESIHDDVQAMSGCCKDMTDRLAVSNFNLSDYFIGKNYFPTEEEQ